MRTDNKCWPLFLSVRYFPTYPFMNEFLWEKSQMLESRIFLQMSFKNITENVVRLYLFTYQCFFFLMAKDLSRSLTFTSQLLLFSSIIGGHWLAVFLMPKLKRWKYLILFFVDRLWQKENLVATSLKVAWKCYILFNEID